MNLPMKPHKDVMQYLAYRLIVISIILLMLFFAKSVILPLAFATIFALALATPTRYLEKKGFKRSLAASVCLVLALLLLSGIFVFISTQVINFRNDFPQLEYKFNELITNAQVFIQERMHVSGAVIRENVDPLLKKLLNETPNVVGTMLSFFSSSLLLAVFTFIYTLLILIYKDNIATFLNVSFRHLEDDAMEQIVSKTQNVIKGYLNGLLIEMVMVAAFLAIGFSIAGAKYAILLAVISAMMNVVPYLGFITAAIISVVITFATNSPHAAMWIGIISIIVHLIDSNIILPVLVGNKISINALATIVSVFLGSLIWGIPGMFLAVPAIAIFKVIFDEIPSLKHWGILLGGRPKIPKMKKVAVKK
ncbi:AI-2E family transporter [Taibaiella sp. KBW10]|uniref:AI-2E family transporter n=1 Tax=Taibaiella sp. KBW10 TaxID=2153357 RepID=UPI000F5AB532|nr:AI-2E family transporter [Taibaiella sp. KBW10]RQO31577.1 AI-2E family transporter [Taibaiella sp. KBW10]